MPLRMLFATLLVLITTVAPAASASADNSRDQRVTARLGISAGEAIQDVPLGTRGFALARHIPELFTTAARLGISIETVSVGFGFFADGDVLLSEHDLDLVVRGDADDIELMAAILGKAWQQSVVFIWFPRRGGEQSTATVPLTGGANQLTDEVYQDLIGPLSNGAHVRYFGRESLLFVANIGGEPEREFAARMQSVLRILVGNKVAVGRLQFERADFTEVAAEDYDAIIRAGCKPRPRLCAA